MLTFPCYQTGFNGQVLAAIDGLTQRFGTAAWLPMICRELRQPEHEVLIAIEEMVASGILQWRDHGLADVERVPA